MCSSSAASSVISGEGGRIAVTVPGFPVAFLVVGTAVLALISGKSSSRMAVSFPLGANAGDAVAAVGCTVPPLPALSFRRRTLAVFLGVSLREGVMYCESNEVMVAWGEERLWWASPAEVVDVVGVAL